eukprot:1790770-Pleurochrysis_carterae.AAC.4
MAALDQSTLCCPSSGTRKLRLPSCPMHGTTTLGVARSACLAGSPSGSLAAREVQAAGEAAATRRSGEPPFPRCSWHGSGPTRRGGLRVGCAARWWGHNTSRIRLQCASCSTNIRGIESLSGLGCSLTCQTSQDMQSWLQIDCKLDRAAKYIRGFR